MRHKMADFWPRVTLTIAAAKLEVGGVQNLQQGCSAMTEE